jgi:hypothetical protein
MLRKRRACQHIYVIGLIQQQRLQPSVLCVEKSTRSAIAEVFILLIGVLYSFLIAKYTFADIHMLHCMVLIAEVDG